jgi:uncharacterized protein (DUF2062 family)
MTKDPTTLTGRIHAGLFSLLLAHGSPPRVSLAAALGVFIGCSPLWGFHTILAIGLSFLLGLNKPAVVFGTFVPSPWFAPFLVFSSLEAGSLLLYGHSAPLSRLEIRTLLDDPHWQHILQHYLLPYVAGSVLVGLALAFVTFWIVLWVIG